MTINQHLSLICRTLLLPFCDPRPAMHEQIQRKAALYRRFLTRSGTEHELYQQYSHLRNQIIESLSNETPPDSFDDIQQMLDMFYSDIELCEAMEDCKHDAYPLDRFYIARILEISDSFVTLRNGRPALRTWTNRSRPDLFDAYSGLHKAELWNMLARLATPDLWIAGYYHNAGQSDMLDLQNLPDDLLLADHVLLRRLDHGLAETHMHFNAGMNYRMLWELVSDVTALHHSHASLKRHGPILRTLLMAGLLRLFLAEYLNICPENQDFIEHLQDFLACSSSKSPFAIIRDVIYDAYRGAEPNQAAGCMDRIACDRYFEKYDACTQCLTEMLSITPFHLHFDLLNRSIYRGYRDLNVSCDVLLLHQALPIACQPDRPQLRHALLQYIRWKNYFFRHCTQAETVHGLRSFHSFYQRAAGAAYTTRLSNAANIGKIDLAVNYAIFHSQCRLPHLKLLEFKISPPLKSSMTYTVHDPLLKNRIARQLYSVFSAYVQFMEDCACAHRQANETPEQTLTRLAETHVYAFPTPGAVYHFIKPDLLRSSFGQLCWVMGANEKKYNAYYIETLREQCMDFCDTLTTMFREVPYLGEYVVGLDAASEELNAEPWIYAPVFTYSRRRHNTYPTQLHRRTPIPTLGLTYHVGEDFRHILSGLRMIDEVLDHFGFKSGDRIGHSLALQIEPERWRVDHHVVSLPIIEYLENMLWLWGLKNQGSSISEPPDLDLKIMQTAEKLYNTTQGLTPYVLWTAYQNKFLSLDVVRRKQDVSCVHCVTRQLHPASCPLQIDSPMYWDANLILLTHFCPIYREKYRKPIFVNVPKTEIALLSKLQEWMKEKVGRHGITIEVNPTSNASIGAIEGLNQHPLLNLNNCNLAAPEEPRQNLSISINSDDPLVFHTTVESELSYVYYMLTEMGYMREDVLNWIDQVRQFGLNSSFIQKEKKPGTLLQELRALCQHLQQVYQDA